MPEDVYLPAEDSYLAAENLEVEEHKTAIDIGSGCGLLAVLAAKRTARVIAVDINPNAAYATHENAKRNGLSHRVDTIVGDMFQSFRDGAKFDRIICNPPYLPEDIVKADSLSNAWSGGSDGRLQTERFLAEAPLFLREGGEVTLVQSSLSEGESTIERLKTLGFQIKKVTRRKFDFESILCIIASLAPK